MCKLSVWILLSLSLRVWFYLYETACPVGLCGMPAIYASCCDMKDSCFILLEDYAGAMSGLICTGVPMMAITSNKFVITKSSFSKPKVVVN